MIGLMLAMIGIYGVLSYSVSQRTREIAIRSALGATRARILTMVVGDALMLAAGGIVIGLTAAAAGTRAISDLLHGTDARDPIVYFMVAVGIVVVTAIAALVPARQAAKTQPVDAMKTG